MLWERLNQAFAYFLSYIIEKGASRCYLTVIDLVLVSNFKGGNASITEPIDTLNEKLPIYSDILWGIQHEFGMRPLQDLQPAELPRLIQLCEDFLSLSGNAATSIRGLGASFSSALIAAHFPRLVPVLDRRVLNGANICGAGINYELNNQGQVQNIETHFGEYIEFCHSVLLDPPEPLDPAPNSLRMLDRALFYLN